MLVAVGAVGGLIGDAGHVQSGTTTYLMTGVPFIWESAVWFVALVGIGTVATAELRLRLAPVRESSDDDFSVAVGAVAVVIGIYALTALVLDEPLLPAAVVIYVLAAVVWHISGDGWASAACGIAAAVFGTTVEILLSAAGVFEYDPSIDLLLGVPPWLPALYFAFGVAVARLAELLAARGWAAGRM
jgi:hypothetical protein